MTQDEIIRMAREAGFVEDTNCEIYGSYYHLERFAALVAAHEREVIAEYVDRVFAAIRARGEKLLNDNTKNS